MNARVMIRMFLLIGLARFAVAGSHFVVPPGTPSVTPTPPYDSWGTAGTDLNVVVAAALAGSAPRTVTVGDGVYYLTNQVDVTGAITLQSLNGRDVTVVDGNNTAVKAVTNRCFRLTAHDIVLSGFTIQNGYATGTDGGGGVFCASDRRISVTDCRVINCIATNGTDSAAFGGGVNVGSQAALSRCDVIGNNNYGAYGGGVYALGNVTDCTIASNVAHYAFNSAGVGSAEGNGGGVMTAAGTISNCNIFANAVMRSGALSGGGRYGGGVRISYGGRMFNSLVHHNSAGTGGGIWVMHSTSFQNCTIADNTPNEILVANRASETNLMVNVICRSSSPGSITLNTSGFNILQSCCVPSTNFVGVPGSFVNNIQSNPQFENIGAFNYRLAKGSPCINTGTNEAWMAGAVDLDGNRRIDLYSHLVDMGAYEYVPLNGFQMIVR